MAETLYHDIGYLAYVFYGGEQRGKCIGIHDIHPVVTIPFQRALKMALAIVAYAVRAENTVGHISLSPAQARILATSLIESAKETT